MAEPMKVWRYVLEDGTRRRWLVGEPPPAGSFPIGDAVEAEEVEVIPVSELERVEAERDKLRDEQRTALAIDMRDELFAALEAADKEPGQ